MSNEKTRMEWATVACVNQLHSAHMMKSILEEEGIPVFLKDEMTARTYTNPTGGINVQVPDIEVDRARALLTDSGLLPR